MTGFKGLVDILDATPAREAMFLVGTGPEGISSNVASWDALANRYHWLSIYLAIGQEPRFPEGHLDYQSKEPVDDAWQHGQEVEPRPMLGDVFPVKTPRGLVSRLFDNHYTHLSQQMHSANGKLHQTLAGYGEDGMHQNRTSLYIAKKKEKSKQPQILSQ